MSNLRLSFAVLQVIVVVSSLGAAQQYTVTDLGTLGGKTSGSLGINDRGQVVGLSTLADTTQRAFVWSSATGMRNLGLLHPSDGYSTANGINNSGQVVGVSGDFAFLWLPGSGMQDLGNLGGIGAIAYGINNLGEVVGSSNTTDQSTHAFFWTSSGWMQDIGTLGIGSVAYAINDSEEVAGTYTLSDGKTLHAFKWTPTGGMVDLGTLGGPSSTAFAISPSGQIAGVTSDANFQTEGFVWNQTRGMRSLNFAGTAALGINSAGQVVGYVSLGSNQSGFLWTNANGVQNLSGLISPKGTQVNQANAINKAGEIVGSNSKLHALLLTPTKQPSSERSRP
jgi:probable HAF family extracellular repeat protein